MHFPTRFFKSDSHREGILDGTGSSELELGWFGRDVAVLKLRQRYRWLMKRPEAIGNRGMESGMLTAEQSKGYRIVIRLEALGSAWKTCLLSSDSQFGTSVRHRWHSFATRL